MRAAAEPFQQHTFRAAVAPLLDVAEAAALRLLQLPQQLTLWVQAGQGLGERLLLDGQTFPPAQTLSALLAAQGRENTPKVTGMAATGGTLDDGTCERCL